METFSALLAICSGNSPVPGEFPTQRPVTWNFGVFFGLGLKKRLSKQSLDWSLRRYRAHYDVTVMNRRQATIWSNVDLDTCYYMATWNENKRNPVLINTLVQRYAMKY